MMSMKTAYPAKAFVVRAKGCAVLAVFCVRCHCSDNSGSDLPSCCAERPACKDAASEKMCFALEFCFACLREYIASEFEFYSRFVVSYFNPLRSDTA